MALICSVAACDRPAQRVVGLGRTVWLDYENLALWAEVQLGFCSECWRHVGGTMERLEALDRDGELTFGTGGP